MHPFNMLLNSFVGLLAVSLTPCVLANASPKATTLQAAIQTPVAERGIFSSVPLAACSTVSGLASPQPSGATCNLGAYNTALAGTGTLVAYSNGPYVNSITSCGQICLATPNCSSVYFTLGKACNLHFGVLTYSPDGKSPFRLYQDKCFQCPSLTLPTETVKSSAIVSISKTTSPFVPSSSSTGTISAILPPFQSPWISLQTNPELYNLALTTTYTQSPQCTGEAITQMAWHGPNLWENAIHPVAASVITTCYPSQFYSSVMGAINSVALPAFSALVCPDNWVAWNYNITYIACCPRGFGVNAPYYNVNTDRPYSGAACTSRLGPGQLYDITSYDSTAFLTVVPTSAPTDGTMIRVNAFDGIMANGAAPVTQISSATSTSISSTSGPCPTSVKVTFQVPFKVTNAAAGESINIIGSVSSLGKWAVADSIRMSQEKYTAADPLWVTTVSLAPGTYVEYKYLHILADGSIVWGADPNFSFTVPTNCVATQANYDAWR